MQFRMSTWRGRASALLTAIAGSCARTYRPPSLAEFARWQQASGGLVGMVTLPRIGTEWKTTFRDCPETAPMCPSDTQTRLRSKFTRSRCGRDPVNASWNGSAGMIPRHTIRFWPSLPTTVLRNPDRRWSSSSRRCVEVMLRAKDCALHSHFRCGCGCGLPPAATRRRSEAMLNCTRTDV